MTGIDREKLKRLEVTFELNFRLTRLYATYLEHFPELITEEMISTLKDGTDLSSKEAIVAILCEAFGLDMDNGSLERRFIREYVTPSARILDAKRYTENPYYKNIRIDNVTDGSWSLKRESYPPYRAVICDDMMLLSGFSEIAPIGFFEQEFRFPAVLEDGNEWMTLTPVDLDTSEEAISAARGRVITFGLGLGYYAYMASMKSEVDSVTVVEKSPDVIRLFKKHILPQFPNSDKIRIIEADAFEYAEEVMPNECYDLAFVDTWRDASDGVPMYERMKALEKLSPNTEFMYWIEGFLRSRLRAMKFVEILEKIESGSPDAPDSYDEVEKTLNSI